MASSSQQCHCENCETKLLDNYRCCHNCGNRSRGMYFMLSYNDLAILNKLFLLIQYLFFPHLGYSYEIIVDFLKKQHGIDISLRSLKRRLQKYGLKRRNTIVNEEMIRNTIRVEKANAGEQSGYRTIWHALRLIHHVHPPRELVSQILRKLDPDESNARKSRKLKRRKYLSRGPNHCWHVDGTFL